MINDDSIVCKELNDDHLRPEPLHATYNESIVHKELNDELQEQLRPVEQAEPLPVNKKHNRISTWIKNILSKTGKGKQKNKKTNNKQKNKTKQTNKTKQNKQKTD